MKENVSFRSAFNGFNREDVVSYISGQMEKIAEAEKASEKLAQQSAEMAQELETLRGAGSEWEREREELQNRCHSLEKDCAEWKERSEALEAEQADWKEEHAQMLDRWEKERAAMSARIESLERQLGECDKHSKSSEKKLGAAMMEAKRFSEMLVKEANDRAGSVYENASACVDGSTASAEELREQMKSLNFEFNKTMSAILSDMNGLIDAMKSFKHDIRDNGAQFLYQSEFTGEAADE